jgi:hypothetical protein
MVGLCGMDFGFGADFGFRGLFFNLFQHFFGQLPCLGVPLRSLLKK